MNDKTRNQSKKSQVVKAETLFNELKNIYEQELHMLRERLLASKVIKNEDVFHQYEIDALEFVRKYHGNGDPVMGFIDSIPYQKNTEQLSDELEKIIEGQFSDITDTGLAAVFLQKSASDAYLQSFPVAMVCYYWAKYLLSQNMKANGCGFILKALVFIGVNKCEKYGENIKKLRANERNSKARIEGEARKYHLVKCELIDLLKNKMPKGRWKTKAAAFNDVFDDLVNIIDEKYNNTGHDFDWEGAAKTIEKWSREDPFVREAFSMVVQPKK